MSIYRYDKFIFNYDSNMQYCTKHEFKILFIIKNIMLRRISAGKCCTDKFLVNSKKSWLNMLK